MNDSALKIENAWGEKSEELINEIVAFWKAQEVIPKNENPFQRALQVLLVVRNEKDEIIGLTTAYRVSYAPLRNTFYAFRGMIAPHFRVPGLFIKMTVRSLQTLEKQQATSKDKAPIGVIAELENPQLKDMRRTMLPSGLTLVGFSTKNHPIYVYYFKGTFY